MNKNYCRIHSGANHTLSPKRFFLESITLMMLKIPFRNGNIKSEVLIK